MISRVLAAITAIFLMTVMIGYSGQVLSSEGKLDYSCKEVLQNDTQEWANTVNKYMVDAHLGYLVKISEYPIETQNMVVQLVVEVCHYENMSIREAVDTVVEETTPYLLE